MSTHGLHVLVVTETWPPDRGGMAVSCDRVVRGLRQRGVGVDVVAFSRRHTHVAVEEQEGGRLIVAPLDEEPGHAVQQAWNALASDASSTRLTHVMAFGGLLPLVAGPAFAAWTARPLLTLLRGNDFDLGWFSPRRGEAVREAVARSAAVCTVCDEHRWRLARLVPDIRVVCIPNGIDVAEWQFSAGDRAQAAEWRARTISPETIVLGLFGHLKRKKGVGVLVDALRRSGHAGRVHLLVVGEPDDDLRARLEAPDSGVASTIVAPVDRWALLPHYAAVDWVALPSLYDGLPNVLLEAGALGIPVLASTAGGLRDVAIDDATAITFAPGDRAACRRALDRALGMRAGERRALGERLRSRVHAELTAEREVAAYVDLLAATCPGPADALATAAASSRESPFVQERRS